jgi:hypothetical protein
MSDSATHNSKIGLENFPGSHVDGPGESSTQTATTGVFLNPFIDQKTIQNEAEFFDAVKRGDIDLVKSKLDDTNNPVNINAINRDGETALQIAAENSHYQDIVHFLIQKNCVIKEPHECECACEEECKGKTDMLRSQIAIKRFRLLSSPVCMCLR